MFKFLLGAVILALLVGVGLWGWQQLQSSALFNPEPPKPRDLSARVDTGPPLPEGYLAVTNTGQRSWTETVFTINGLYAQAFAEPIHPGGQVMLAYHQFLDRDTGAPYSGGLTGLRKFDFETADGRFNRRD